MRTARHTRNGSHGKPDGQPVGDQVPDVASPLGTLAGFANGNEMIS
ncbi:hypothetical protein Z948_2219 [Sulfitobacter donghicola DSW-25 = KCTC 12864 = JCM 14565]|nr:hypothetical protein Z948_2219 [Sulfitobacter donghicola DSW-25 = KCTC 12864 = JCM 14565]